MPIRRTVCRRRGGSRLRRRRTRIGGENKSMFTRRASPRQTPVGGLYRRTSRGSIGIRSRPRTTWIGSLARVRPRNGEPRISVIEVATERRLERPGFRASRDRCLAKSPPCRVAMGIAQVGADFPGGSLQLPLRPYRVDAREQLSESHHQRVQAVEGLLVPK